MAIEQFRSVLPDEASQEQNARYQVNNPNVTIAKVEQPTAPTEMTQPQTTNNPANNGVVPTSQFS